MIELDGRQRATLAWAGLAVVLAAFDGSILVLALPAVASEFHASVRSLTNVGSLLTLGALGALPLATLADRFGRRRLVAVSVAGFSIANLASAFAPSLLGLATFRFVAVCFETLAATVTTALIVEEAPRTHRGEAVSVLAILSGGGLLIAIIAYPLLAPHWRWLFLASGLGLGAAPLVWRFLPEGRAWEQVQVTGSSIRLLMAPPWWRRVAILAATTALVSLVLRPAGLLYTYFASATLHFTPAAISILIFASGAVALAAYVAGGYLTDRFGRHVPGVALTAGYALFAGFEFVLGKAGFVAGNVLWSALASAATPVLGAWSGELYPTRARATAESAAAVAGAVGGLVGLQAVGLLSQSTGLGPAMAIAAVFGVAGAGLLALLPETKEQPLPE